MSTIRADLEFRKHVSILASENAFKNPEDALLYCIKERNAREFNHQIRSLSMNRPNTAHRLFDRNDVLTEDDYNFVFQHLKTESKLKLLESLLDRNSSANEFDRSDRSPHIRRLLYSSASLEDSQALGMDVACNNGKLLNLVACYFPKEQEASEVYINLARSTLDKPESNFFSAQITLITDALLMKEASTRQTDFWHFKSDVTDKVREVFDLNQNQIHLLTTKLIEASNDLDDVPELIDFKKKIDSRLHVESQRLLESFKVVASQALLAFGTPGTKSGAKSIPEALKRLVRSVRSSNGIDPVVRNQIMTQVVLKLCMVNQRHMQPDAITAIFDEVKQEVDWEVAVKGMNARGREALMKTFKEKNYYQEYLKLEERGAVLEHQLGL